MTFLLTVLVVILSVTTLISLFYAVHFWWQSRRFTRERFAFTIAAFIASSFFLFAISFSAQKTPWQFGVEILFTWLGLDYSPQLIRPEVFPYLLLSTTLLAIVGYSFLFLIYKNWPGEKSVLQDKRQKNNTPESPIYILTDSAVWVQDWFRQKKLTMPVTEVQDNEPPFEAPKPLSWSERVRELWTLRHPEYEFSDEDWHPTNKCWLGKHKHTTQPIMLACFSCPPNDELSLGLIRYAEQVLGKTDNLRIIVALEGATPQFPSSQGEVDNASPFQREIRGGLIEFFTESQLVDGLVDFSSYFNRIERLVAKDTFTGLDLTVEDMYTKSDYKLSKEGERQQDVESFIDTWLAENSKRHLSILGEFGYGKSTLSQMLTYRLLKEYQAGKSVRIPVIIELRGKIPCMSTPKNLFATWAEDLGIDPRAMMQLLLAGRLLVIFEGFDEVNLLGGDQEMRLQHFVSLWRFAHDKAKVLFTGRHNFFFDEKELRQALLIQQPSEYLPYCQAVYLEPFNLVQIQHSLKRIKPDVQQEILALAEIDTQFQEVAPVLPFCGWWLVFGTTSYLSIKIGLIRLMSWNYTLTKLLNVRLQKKLSKQKEKDVLSVV